MLPPGSSRGYSTIAALEGYDGRRPKAMAPQALNDLVAVTVVILTVFAAISKVRTTTSTRPCRRQNRNRSTLASISGAHQLHVDENGFRRCACSRLPDRSTRRSPPTSGRIRVRHQEYTARSAGRWSRQGVEAIRPPHFRDDQFDIRTPSSIAVASRVAALVDSFVLLTSPGPARSGVCRLAGFLGSCAAGMARELWGPVTAVTTTRARTHRIDRRICKIAAALRR